MKCFRPVALLCLTVALSGCARRISLQPIDVHTGTALTSFSVEVRKTTIRKLSFFPGSRGSETNTFPQTSPSSEVGSLSHRSGVVYNLIVKAPGYLDARILYARGVRAVWSPDGIRVASVEPLAFWDGSSPIEGFSGSLLSLPMVPKGTDLRPFYNGDGPIKSTFGQTPPK